MAREIPNTLALQVRADDGWRNITTFSFDPLSGKTGGRPAAMRRARIGLTAWREYHKFQDRPLRIAECVMQGYRPEWVEVTS